MEKHILFSVVDETDFAASRKLSNPKIQEKIRSKKWH